MARAKRRAAASAGTAANATGGDTRTNHRYWRRYQMSDNVEAVNQRYSGGSCRAPPTTRDPNRVAALPRACTARRSRRSARTGGSARRNRRAAERRKPYRSPASAINVPPSANMAPMAGEEATTGGAHPIAW